VAHHGGRRAPGVGAGVVPPRGAALTRPRAGARLALRAAPLPALTAAPLAGGAAADTLDAVGVRSHAYVEVLTAAPPRLLTYLAILLVVGAALWRLHVLPRAHDAAASAPPAFARARRAVALAGALGGAVGIGGAAWQLAVQFATLGGDSAMMRAVVLHTRWGRLLVAQAAAFAVAALAFRVARRADEESAPDAPAPDAPAPRAYRIAAAAAFTAAAVQAGLGHAGADEAAPVVALASAAVHVLGAAAWIGTLGALAVAWVALGDPRPDPTAVLLAVPLAEPTARSEGGLTLPALADGDMDARRALPAAALVTSQVAAFSRVALVGAGLTAGAGAVNSWLRLAGADGAAPAAARLAALTGSTYGWLLLAKLAVVGAIVAAGAVNWRRNTARLASGDVAAIERTTRVELVVALAALALTSALAITSPPGME
jgi:putative copper export protein